MDDDYDEDMGQEYLQINYSRLGLGKQMSMGPR